MYAPGPGAPFFPYFSNRWLPENRQLLFVGFVDSVCAPTPEGILSSGPGNPAAANLALAAGPVESESPGRAAALPKTALAFALPRDSYWKYAPGAGTAAARRSDALGRLGSVALASVPNLEIGIVALLSTCLPRPA